MTDDNLRCAACGGVNPRSNTGICNKCHKKRKLKTFLFIHVAVLVVAGVLFLLLMNGGVYLQAEAGTPELNETIDETLTNLTGGGASDVKNVTPSDVQAETPEPEETLANVTLLTNVTEHDNDQTTLTSENVILLTNVTEPAINETEPEPTPRRSGGGGNHKRSEIMVKKIALEKPVNASTTFINSTNLTLINRTQINLTSLNQTIIEYYKLFKENLNLTFKNKMFCDHHTKVFNNLSRNVTLGRNIIVERNATYQDYLANGTTPIPPNLLPGNTYESSCEIMNTLYPFSNVAYCRPGVGVGTYCVKNNNVWDNGLCSDAELNLSQNRPILNQQNLNNVSNVTNDWYSAENFKKIACSNAKKIKSELYFNVRDVTQTFKKLCLNAPDSIKANLTSPIGHVIINNDYDNPKKITCNEAHLLP